MRMEAGFESKRTNGADQRFRLGRNIQVRDDPALITRKVIACGTVENHRVEKPHHPRLRVLVMSTMERVALDSLAIVVPARVSSCVS
jgi:hypothetical protein